MASIEALSTSTLTPEGAAAPPPAIEAASRSLIRRVIDIPSEVARGMRDIGVIVMNGDTCEMISSSIHHSSANTKL